MQFLDIAELSSRHDIRVSYARGFLLHFDGAAKDEQLKSVLLFRISSLLLELDILL